MAGKRKVRLTPTEAANVAAAAPPIETASEALPPLNAGGREEPKPFAEQEVTGKQRRASRPRFSVPITEEGLPDLQEARSEQIAQLRLWLTDPKIREQLGVAGLPPDIVFSDEDIGTLVDILGGVECQVFVWFGKIDADIAARIAPWDAQQKKLIIPPFKAVLAKNAASLGWFLKWRDEIALILLFVTITRAKYSACKALQQMRKEGKIPAMDAKPAPEPQPQHGKEFLEPQAQQQGEPLQ